jgi:hypothetical protein
MKTQTAVEWLIEELGEYFPHEIGGIHLMVEQAKQMEKEQTCQFISDYIDDGQDLTAEEYYEETYGGE